MGNKQFAKDPLLYIQQPSIQTPEAPMQHNYYTPTRESGTVNEEVKSRENVYTRALRRNHFVKNNVIQDEENDEEINKDEDEKENETLPNQAKFKDMTLKQKVAYFVDRPSHAPIMKCEVKTEEKTYHGIIMESEDDQVFIRVGRRSSSTKIPFDEIISIRMLGF